MELLRGEEEEDVELIDEEEEEEESSHAEDDGDGDDEAVSGWADSIANILRSKKDVEPHKVILSRAKKDKDIQKKLAEIGAGGSGSKNKDELEIVPSNSQSAKSKKKATDNGSKKSSKRKSAAGESSVNSTEEGKKKSKSDLVIGKEWENINRVKPNPTQDREHEWALMRIASKGVAQLFNAVEIHKKTRQEENMKKKVKKEAEDDSDDE